MSLQKRKLELAQEFLESFVKNKTLPGYVALISKGDEIWTACGGHLTFEGPAAMTRDTLFRISSMTKPITSAALLMLVDDGVMSLDSSVAKWLPELAQPKVLRKPDAALEDVVPAKCEITVRDLLTYTFGSGMLMAPPENFPILMAMRKSGIELGPPAPQHHLPSNEFMKRFGEFPLIYQPGERWLYSRASALQGILIERASKKSLGAFFEERLFKPLGMTNTRFAVDPKDVGRFPTGYMNDYVTDELQIYDEPRTSQWLAPLPLENGADGLVSTAEDYYKFARMLLNKGQWQGRQILSRNAVQEMTRNQLQPQQKFGFFDEGKDYGFGFGVQMVTKPGPRQSMGQYNWDGGLGTTWIADPAQDLVAILMTQRAWTSPSIPDHANGFNQLAHEAAKG